jgi:Immunity protein 49
MISERMIDEYSYETAFWMAGVYSPDYPLDQLGEVCADVQTKLRMLACFRLLKDGRPDSFYHNLIRSGMTRRHYLNRCIAEGALEDHFRGSGRYLPFCDSVAAGEFELASSIIELSPAEFLRGHEYEDDYCYGRILYSVFSGTNEELPVLLTRFADYLEGAENGRLLVASALAQRDQSAFEKAFEHLLLDREQEIAADAARGQIGSPQVIMGRRIFIEGLAILRIAERLGLSTEDEYLFCPSIARVPMTRPFPGE